MNNKKSWRHRIGTAVAVVGGLAVVLPTYGMLVGPWRAATAFPGSSGMTIHGWSAPLVSFLGELVLLPFIAVLVIGIGLLMCRAVEAAERLLGLVPEPEDERGEGDANERPI